MSSVNQIKLFPYQERILDEKAALDEKLIALNRVICGVRSFSVPDDEQKRMRNQALAMKLYSNILKERIASWQTT